MSLARVVYKGPTNVSEDYIKNNKWRYTCTYNPRQQVRNYQLNLNRFLVETDAPYLESDFPRNNNQTENIINLRKHGMRYDKYPDHSEANFELTEPDPRGYSNLPDLQRFRDRFQNTASKYEYQFGVDGSENHIDKQRDGTRLQADRQEYYRRYRRQFNNFSYGLQGQVSSGLKFHEDGTYVNPDNLKVMRALGEQMTDNEKQAVKSFKYAPPNSEHQIGYYSINDARLRVASYDQIPIRGHQLLLKKESDAHKVKRDQSVKDNKQRGIEKNMVLTMNDAIKRKRHVNKEAMTQLSKLSKQSEGRTGVTDAKQGVHGKSEYTQESKRVLHSELRNMKLDTNLREAMDRAKEDRRKTVGHGRKTAVYKNYTPERGHDMTKLDTLSRAKTGRDTMIKKTNHRAKGIADNYNYQHTAEDNRGMTRGMARPSNKTMIGEMKSNHGNDSVRNSKPGSHVMNYSRVRTPSRTLGRYASYRDSKENSVNEV